MQRALAVLIVSGFAVACEGRLDNKDRFIMGGMDGGEDCTDVENKIFRPKCGGAGCHENPGAASGLDLVKDGGIKQGLEGNSTCMSKPLKTYMLEKVSMTPGCGQPMPFGSDPLTAAEVKCLTDYMATVGDGGI